MTTSPTYLPGFTHRITVQSVRETALPTTACDTAESIHAYWQDVIATQPDYEPDKESVCVVMLNCRLIPFAWHRVSLGTVSECTCHPREVFRPAVASGAAYIALMHNHPSGDPAPSRADDLITRNIVEAAKIMQIPMIDHIIVGESAPGRKPFYSFREAGIIP